MNYYLHLFAASDSQIDFITAHPNTLWNFMEGSMYYLPSPEKDFSPKPFNAYGEEEGCVATLVKAPGDWPTNQVEMLGPEISDLDIELYHRILCGGDVFVVGAGSIFQTWMVRVNGSSVDIGKKGENFAFFSDQVTELIEIMSEVNEQRVLHQYSLWLEEKRMADRDLEKTASRLTQEFADLTANLREVEKSGKGLIWVRS